jgi:hypothetical protein
MNGNSGAGYPCAQGTTRRRQPSTPPAPPLFAPPYKLRALNPAMIQIMVCYRLKARKRSCITFRHFLHRQLLLLHVQSTHVDLRAQASGQNVQSQTSIHQTLYRKRTHQEHSNSTQVNLFPFPHSSISICAQAASLLSAIFATGSPLSPHPEGVITAIANGSALLLTAQKREDNNRCQ